MAEYITNDTDLGSVANAIRTQGGTSATLEFPDDFITAIGNLGGGTPTLQTKSKSYTPTESQQTETVTYDTGYDGLEKVNVTVGAISSTYVGSGITQRTSSDLSASNLTVTAPAGYYASSASKTCSDANLVAGNIKSGTAIFGVTGNYSGNFTLLGTKSVGTISTSSTTATDTGQTLVLTGWNDYDLLVCECSVDTKTNGRHICTTRLAWLTGTSNVNTKNTFTLATATWNSKLSSSGTATSRSNTTAYGIYVYSGTISGSNLTLTIYQRYNSTQTGTINNSYTLRVYGVKVFDLIGG